MPQTDTLKDYHRVDFTYGKWTRPVFRRGSGPAVIVMHEIPGLHPLVVRFADRIAAAGMTVYCPSLLGTPGRAISGPYIATEIVRAICIRREFDFWSTDRSASITDWLRALARQAHAECGGIGVGAVGMCLTGNFALAMMTEPVVVAPVLSQPSLPIGRKGRAALGVSPADIACAKRRFEAEDLTMIGLRFHGDPLVAPERFAALKSTFGDRFEAIEIDARDAGPAKVKAHSVLTIHLRDDDPDGPTKRAEQRVIAFFRERTGAA